MTTDKSRADALTDASALALYEKASITASEFDSVEAAHVAFVRSILSSFPVEQPTAAQAESDNLQVDWIECEEALEELLRDEGIDIQLVGEIDKRSIIELILEKAAPSPADERAAFESLKGAWQSMPPFDVFCAGWQAARAASANETGAEVAAELESMTRMFHAACYDLGLINEALGLDPDDGGAEPILDAIAELRAQIASAQTDEPVAWAVYNGWSRICFYKTEEDARDHAQKAQKNHDLSGSLAAFRVVPLYTAPHPTQADPRVELTDEQREAIAAMIELTRATFIALDDSEEQEGADGRQHAIDSANFDAVSNALDRLEELPDDKPGETLNAAGKAEWALRALLNGADQS
ncbi:TPA: hypothetical protein SAP12_002807 [Burkholderia multivorans]|nr:hypothetical protein [Burkholderia multivorans]